MEQIAVIVGHTYLYWSSILRVLAAGAAVFAFAALYLHKSGNMAAAAVTVPVALVLSVALARLVHWYFRPELYDSLEAAMQLGSPGGFALMGAFGGCVLAAALVRLLHLTRNLPELLDCMAIAGCLGIGVGRLGFWFNSGDRGMVLETAAWYPWVSGSLNPVSGQEEARLSVFLIQAVAAGVLFTVLLVWYLAGMKRHRDGDGVLLFLLCYGASQVLLDSMRYDALRFRSNGFLGAVQVLSAVGMLAAVVVFAAVLVSATGWRRSYGLLWALQTGCIATAGYMEYYVQRHGNAAGMAYGVMGAALLALVGLALWSRLAERGNGGGADGKAAEKTDQIPE